MGLFGGSIYEEKHDKSRLLIQLARVKDVMLDGQWRTLDELSAAVSAPPASVSARLRDLRKKKFGSYTVLRRSRGPRKSGLFEYRVVVPRTKAKLPALF